MGVVVKYTGRISSGIDQLEKHLKYIGFRSDENKEKEIRLEKEQDKSLFFNKDKNNKDYKDFIKEIEDNKALKHSKSVKAHKLVFSLREKDFENYINYGEGKTYRDLVRNTLEEYSIKTGKKLDWIASEHLTEGNKIDGYRKSKHPHVHVVIKGVSENNERVLFKQEDYKFLRETFDKEFEKVCAYDNTKDFKYDNNKSKDTIKSLDQEFAKTLNKVVKKMQKEVDKDFSEKLRERKRLNEERSKERERERIKR